MHHQIPDFQIVVSRPNIIQSYNKPYINGELIYSDLRFRITLNWFCGPGSHMSIMSRYWHLAIRLNVEGWYNLFLIKYQSPSLCANTYEVFIIQNYGLRFSLHCYWQGRLTKVSSIHYLSSLNVWDNQWTTVWRKLWYSRETSYYSSLELKHPHTRQCSSLVSPSLFPIPKTSQAASGNETIPVWDRWKWRPIGSLKAS